MTVNVAFDRFWLEVGAHYSGGNEKGSYRKTVWTALKWLAGALKPATLLRDIDGSKIVWARELGEEQNAKLFAYFQDRHIWLVEPDVDNTEIKPYTPPPDQ